MCGLALVATKKDKKTGNRVYDLFNKQRGRGVSGFGYVSINNGVVVDLQRSKTEGEIKKPLLKERSEIVVFHHRQPTSTPNTLGTTHPMLVQNDELEYDYMLMHNGVISNHAQLKKNHEQLGYKYKTEYIEIEEAQYLNLSEPATEHIGFGQTKYNDSESLAIELARFLEGKTSRVGTMGAAAFICIVLKKDSDEVVDIVYGQNYGRSLGRKDKKGWTTIASETGQEVPQMKLFHFNPITFETTESELVMDEARPVPPPSYGFGSHPKPKGPERVADSEEYDLKNAYYTYEEAIESGAPLSLFFRVQDMRIDGKLTQMYVPNRYGGAYSKDRPLFRDEYYYVSEEPVVSKEQERLEEMSMLYARKQYEVQVLEDLLYNGKITPEQYGSKSQLLDQACNKLEEQMYSLGIPEDVVEETVATAQELVDYEYKQR